MKTAAPKSETGMILLAIAEEIRPVAHVVAAQASSDAKATRLPPWLRSIRRRIPAAHPF